jgi:putative ABC transport system substrate-binding protein
VQAQPPAPGDLPVQSPAQFEFVLNMRAAKEVGLSIPPAVRTRATEILE